MLRRWALVAALAVLAAAPAGAHEPESAAWAPWSGGPRLGAGAVDVLRQVPVESAGAPGLDVLRRFPLSTARLRALGRGRAGGRAAVHGASAARTAQSGPVAHATRASTERAAAEPTMGVTSDGTLFYVDLEGSRSVVLRSRDEGATWDQLDVLVAGQGTEETTFDPFLWVDKATDRVFNADLTTPNCAGISFSDDRGDTFATGTNCLHTDHQNLFAGPPPGGGAAPAGYKHVVYYCSQEFGATLASGATSCSKSLDGGSTWVRTATPAFTPDPARAGGSFGIPGFCSGAVGHGVADSKGVVYLPRGWCDQPYLGISRDEGDTWERVQVAELGMATGIEDEVLVEGAGLSVEDHEASVAVDPAGTLYYFWIARDHMPYLAVSRDGGKTFAKPLMVAAPGVNEAWGPSIDAGDDGRVAFTYIGTTNSPGGPYCARTTGTTTCETADGGQPTPKSAYEKTTWNGYMGISVDADAAAPTFQTVTVNDPADPLVAGGGCGPVRCLAQLDFLDVVVARDGTAWASFVDACEVDACSGSGTGIVGRVVGGPPLVGTIAQQTPVVAAPAPAPRCDRPRRVRVRIAVPRRGRIRSARVVANGKRVRVSVDRRGRRSAVVDLRRFRGRAVRVVVVVRTTTGRTVRTTRRYRVCA